MSRLILASRSPARIAMLQAAGVPFTAHPADVDEEGMTEALLAAGVGGRDVADALAELKAVKLSRTDPDTLVLGCDTTVVAADETLVSKAATLAAARDQLRALAGTTHRLHSAAVVAQGGRPVWRHVETARLTMRGFSDAFLDAYLEKEWPAIAGCVGGYRLEALGVQLFDRIEGSHFTILGLPLLPLLAWLRERGVLPR